MAASAASTILPGTPNINFNNNPTAPTTSTPAAAAPVSSAVTTPGVSGTQPTIAAPTVGNTPELSIPAPASNKYVAAFQQQLNSKNAGQPGYVPLNVDGVYGPKTQAAAQYQAVAPSVPAYTTDTTTTNAEGDTVNGVSQTDLATQIQNIIGEQGTLGNEINGVNEGQAGGGVGTAAYRGAVTSAVKGLTANNAALQDQLDNLQKFYDSNQTTLDDQQKEDLQNTIDEQKTNAATLTAAQKYAFQAAVKAGESETVLNAIANATTPEEVYDAVQGTSKYTGVASPTIVSIGEQKLNASRGPDGYVDPNLYQQAFNDWTAHGYSTASFVKAYPPDQYVNPANTFLPEYLMPTAAQTKTSSSDRTL